MTQIAATTASHAGKAGHGMKSSVGAKSAEGTDFASLFGALDPSTDDDAAFADASVTSEDAGTGSRKDKDGGKGAIVLDLGLDAAAQSAMADTVVAAQPQAFVAPPPAKGDGKGETVAALDTKTAPTAPAWRSAQASANVKAVKDGKASPVAQPATAQTGTSAAATQDATAQTQVPVPQSVAGALAKSDTPVAKPATRSIADKGAPARRTTQDSAAPQDAEQPAAQDDAAQDDKASALPPIFAALPQAVLDPRQAQAASATQAGKAANTATATDPVTDAAVQAAVSEAAVSPAPVPARPVMSALHRAVPAAGQASTATQTAQAVQPGGSSRHGQGDTAQDQGKGNGASTTTLGSDTDRSSAIDASASTGPSFSDVLQSLPPIAQSRMDLVANAGPVTAASDVGATLQGQVIDMGVGGQWIDRMAKEITAMSDGNGHSRFQLSPPNLGRIQVDIKQGESGGTVQILTETDEAARRLRDGKADLQADARMSALSINSITIDRAQAGFDGGRENSQQSPSQRHQSAEQGFGQQGAQTGSQDSGQGAGQGGRNPQQSAMQAGGQSGSQGGSQAGSQGQQNSANQGKDPWNRDVLRERAGTMAQDGSSVRQNGDRVVRYA